jgi:hypothetical protein
MDALAPFLAIGLFIGIFAFAFWARALERAARKDIEERRRRAGWLPPEEAERQRSREFTKQFLESLSLELNPAAGRYWNQIVAFEPRIDDETFVGTLEAKVFTRARDLRLPGWVVFTSGAVYVAYRDSGQSDGPIRNVRRVPIEQHWPVILTQSPPIVRLLSIDEAHQSELRAQIDAGADPHETLASYADPERSITVEIEAQDLQRFMKLTQEASGYGKDAS